MTTAKAAKAIGVSRATLQRWVHEYGLRPVSTTIAGHYRWDVADLREQVRKAQEEREQAAEGKRAARQRRNRRDPHDVADSSDGDR